MTTTAAQGTAPTRRERILRALLAAHGKTFAEEAGITLKDAPSPLYRLLVLSVLLSAPMSSRTGVAACRALADAGLRTAARMRDSSWQQRVKLLGEAGYRRFDERTATMLGDGAELVMSRWGGDLRRLREESAGDVDELRKLLQEVPGIGRVGSAIFCREVQGVWPEIAPFLDDRVLDGAKRLGLPASAGGLAKLVEDDELPALAAACVRASLDENLVEEVKGSLKAG
ncbi:MAG TPA: endonuclease [Actinomycetales bacterium]|nr:endonuclease [Actinomycetales bacterium]